MKAAWLKNGFVENISVWDENSRTPEGYEIVLIEDDIYVGIGSSYDGSNFIQPMAEEQSE
jgi:hypothetical protein